MKKFVDIAVTVCLLGIAVFFWMAAGFRFVQVMGGAKPLAAGESYAQAEGKYITYDALYPIASYEEAYYSGDADRIRQMGYVVYDAEREAFLYIVVDEQNARGLRALLWNLHLPAELRAAKDMSPVRVKGTLERMEDEAIRHAAAALEESEVLALLKDYGRGTEGEAYHEYYFGDSCGNTLSVMGDKLARGREQTEWYRITDGSVGGLPLGSVWACVLAAGFSFLIALFRISAVVKEGKKEKSGEREATASAGSALEQLLEAQRDWIEEWCARSMARMSLYAYLTAVCCGAALTAVGLFVGSGIWGALTWHLPVGVLFGELAAVFVWFSQKKRSNPNKALRRLRRSIEKEVRSSDAREAFASDLLGTGSEWTFQEWTKDNVLCGIAGSRYWAVFSGLGGAAIVDTVRLEKVETAMESGQIRSGKARILYMNYVARFWYRHVKPKNTWDQSYTFRTGDTLGHFVELAKKRAGDTVEFIEGFSKDVKYSV